LLQLARPFGLDALNFLVAATAGVVLCMALPPHRGRRVLIAAQGLAAILVLTLFAGIGKAGDKHAATTGTMRIAILSDNYDFSTSLYDADAVITQLLARASAITPPVEVVLFPEEVSLTSVFWAEKDATEFLYRLFGDREVLLLHTRSDQYPQDEEVDEDEVKSLSFESTTRGIIGRYDKQMLMPLGEYVPAFAQLFYSVIRDPDIEAHLEYIDRIALTQKMPEAIAFRGVRFGGLLCSDMLSPALYRHLARKERADILINLSNQFWFHGSPRLHHKSLQMARVHAVSHGLPLLVANNMAPSYAIDRHGRVIAETRWGQSDVLIVDMAVPRP
jgi:apolipoprotein N-acyltransferase